MSANHYHSELFFPQGWSWLYFLRLPGHLIFGESLSWLWPAAMTLLVAACWQVWTASPRNQRLAIAAALLPLLGLGLLCIAKPIAVPRYLSWTLPFVALLLAAALLTLPRKVAVGGLSVLVGVNMLGLAMNLRALPREPWKESARALTERMSENDVVVVENDTARSCVVQYLHWMNRGDLGDNVFPWSTYREITGGKFPDPNRSLWLLERRDDLEMGRITRSLNAEVSAERIGGRWGLTQFRGVEAEMRVAPSAVDATLTEEPPAPEG